MNYFASHFVNKRRVHPVIVIYDAFIHASSDFKLYEVEDLRGNYYYVYYYYIVLFLLVLFVVLPNDKFVNINIMH